jgi:hypothetical protein
MDWVILKLTFLISVPLWASGISTGIDTKAGLLKARLPLDVSGWNSITTILEYKPEINQRLKK